MQVPMAGVANLMFQSCDLLVTIGTRLAIPQKGYVDTELARRAEIFVIDCDRIELEKLGERFPTNFLLMLLLFCTRFIKNFTLLTFLISVLGLNI